MNKNNNKETEQCTLHISSKCAVKEASKMMRMPMKDLPKLTLDFLKYLSSKVGMCMEVCLTAYATYNQIVLKMKCDDDLYKPTDPDVLEWWRVKGYCL